MARRTTVLLNADIRTMDARRPRAEACSFSKGRILDIGAERAVLARAGADADILDAGGRTVLPGFIDCHTHFLSLGVWSRRLDLSASRNLSDVLDAIRNRADRTVKSEGTVDAPHLSAGSVTMRGVDASPFMAGSVKSEGRKLNGEKRHAAGWILGRGWDEAKWPDKRYLTRRDLDAASPDRPVMLIRVCGHLATLNTKGLKALGSVIGEKDVDRSTGIIREGALERARYHLRPGLDEMLAGLQHSLGLAKRLGVTSVHDIIGLDKLAAYETAHRQRLLTVRATLHFEARDFMDLVKRGGHTGQGGPLLRIGGMKLYADGSFGARTAALKKPYADGAGGKGGLLHADAQLREVVRKAEQGGFQLLIHAIGDRAARQVVSAFASTLRASTRLRHRIEHLELPGKAELGRMRKLGLWASMQPNFVGEWGRPGGMMEYRLGKRRLGLADPFKKVLRAGVPLVFGSDCMPFHPLYGIHSAVNAPFADQRLTVGEALAAYTRDAAAASFEEGFKGTLSPGKAADLVVLSKDPFGHPASIRDIDVAATFFDGRLIWSGGRRAPLTAPGRSEATGAAPRSGSDPG
jgi:predicted amidohydrolase YtcJ